MKSMIDILKERLPDGLEIINVKGKTNASQSEIWFSYQGMVDKNWISKTCAPGWENKLCDRTIATSMLGFALKLKNIDMIDYWHDKMLNS